MEESKIEAGNGGVKSGAGSRQLAVDNQRKFFSIFCHVSL